MDIRAVDVAIHTQIWPALTALGFDTRKTRTAIRERDDRVDVIVIDSLGRGAVKKIDYTPFSFTVSAGTRLKYIPSDEIALLVGDVRCHASTSLERGYFDFMVRRTLWRIDSKGRRLQKAISDAGRAIRTAGETWFAQFATPQSAFERFLRPRDDLGPLLAGPLDSPLHYYLLGYSARAAGRSVVARANLGKAADSGCFPNSIAQLRQDAMNA